MSVTWRLEEAGLAALDRVAAALALIVRPGDLVALSGALGAGKTTFARALITHVSGDAGEEIPSPTFALMQGYETARMGISHFDFYRLGDVGEVDELGFADALTESLVLVEWPERIAARLPDDRLEVHLDEAGSDDARALTFKGHGAWQPRLARFRDMLAFLDRSGWADAAPRYLQGDASYRTYARLGKPDTTALLMDSPPMSDGPPVRDGKPYSAIAHLAEDVRPYIAIAGALKVAGLSVPDILALDMDQGFVLIEDLGDRVYASEAAAGTDMAELYGAATELLVALRSHAPAATLLLPDGGDYILPAYDTGALAIETELLVDWFWPAVKGEPAPDDARAEFCCLWQDQFEWLQRQPTGWVLRDYHSPNLLWLPERDGWSRVGVIDFQDAVVGPVAYDLVALLQDARTDVPEELEAHLFGQYCAACERSDPRFERSEFTAAYAILGAQRNTKILGIFARLAMRDAKRAYLAHMPRVSAYLERDLAHPALAPLRAWYDRHLPGDARRAPWHI